MTAFERAWDTVKRWPDEVEEVSDLRLPVERAQLPADQMPIEGTEPDDTLEPPIDMGGDACCINAKNKWIEALREAYEKANRPLECSDCDGKLDDTGEPSYPIPDEDSSSSTGYRCWKCKGEIKTRRGFEDQTTSTYQGIYDKYENMTCDEFRLSLEQFAGLQPGHKGFTDAWENTLAHRLLQEWDECSQEAAPEGSTVDMWTSNDPFEAGWGHIAKKQMVMIE